MRSRPDEEDGVAEVRRVSFFLYIVKFFEITNLYSPLCVERELIGG